MAIWQFHIHLIPRQSLINRYGLIPPRLTIDHAGWQQHWESRDPDQTLTPRDALTIYWWLDLSIDLSDMVTLLQPVGPQQTAAENSAGIMSFGHAETSDITVCFDSQTQKVEEISARLDLRLIDKVFLRHLLALAQKYDCLFMDRQGILFDAGPIELTEHIQSSNAFRFVSDPQNFFNDLNSSSPDPF